MQTSELPDLLVSTLVAIVDERMIRVEFEKTHLGAGTYVFANEDDAGSGTPEIPGQLTTWENITIAASSSTDLLIGAVAVYQSLHFFYSFKLGTDKGAGQGFIVHDGTNGFGNRNFEDGSASSALQFSAVLSGGNFYLRITNGNGGSSITVGVTGIPQLVIS